MVLDRPFGKEEAAMRSIIQANIDRFILLLETETDPIKRAMIIRLLAEEKEKQIKASITLEAKHAH